MELQISTTISSDENVFIL